MCQHAAWEHGTHPTLLAICPQLEFFSEQYDIEIVPCFSLPSLVGIGVSMRQMHVPPHAACAAAPMSALHCLAASLCFNNEVACMHSRTTTTRHVLHAEPGTGLGALPGQHAMSGAPVAGSRIATAQEVQNQRSRVDEQGELTRCGLCCDGLYFWVQNSIKYLFSEDMRGSTITALAQRYSKDRELGTEGIGGKKGDQLKTAPETQKNELIRQHSGCCLSPFSFPPSLTPCLFCCPCSLCLCCRGAPLQVSLRYIAWNLLDQVLRSCT